VSYTKIASIATQFVRGIDVILLFSLGGDHGLHDPKLFLTRLDIAVLSTIAQEQACKDVLNLQVAAKPNVCSKGQTSLIQQASHLYKMLF